MWSRSGARGHGQAHETCSLPSVAIVATLACSGPVTAGGFYSPYQSATAIGTAFAGATARADDAGFFYYNPATVSSLEGRQTFFDARGFAPDVEIAAADATSPLGIPITDDGSSGNLGRNALALGSVTVVPLWEGVTLGFGSSAPFATDAETRTGWAGRFHLIKSYIVGMNGTGAVSWQATPWLAIAAGVQVQYMETTFSNSAVIPQLSGPPVESKISLTGTDWELGTVAGLVLTPAEGTRLGIAWRSGFDHDIKAKIKAELPGIPRETAKFDLVLPDVVSVGLEQRITDDWRMFAEFQYVDWSRFEGFDISFPSGRPNEVRPVTWKDTWLVAAGAGYRVTPSTEITAGLSYDTSASEDGSGTTLSPDADKVLVGAGLIHDIEGLGRLSLNYGHLFILEAPVKAASLASGSLSGTLDGHMHMVGLGYSYRW